MLLDILAVAFAFIAVILLLSLVVTGLTQCITASMRLRVRNLRRALTILINDIQGGGAKKSDVKLHVENTITAANFGTTRAPRDMIAGLGLIRVSWILKEDLLDCLQTAGITLPARTAEKALTNFKRLEAYMEKRFALFARYITFGVAIVVATLFQVSSPDLLRRLWSDAELRSRYVAMGEQLQGEDAPAALRGPSGTIDLQMLNLKALGDIAQSFPDEAAAFEEFSGKADDPTDGREELAAVLKDSPHKDKVLAEFEQALGRRLTDAQHRGTLMSDEGTPRLATLDITPWKYGWKFYSGAGCLGLQWDRVAGVLLTTLLLTFGAPFWYARLKDVARLRDVVSGKTEETKTGDTKTGEAKTGETKSS